MDLQLEDRVALVTGSTAGIGAAIAEGLAREGATVVVHGRSQERAEAVVERIRIAGGTAHVALGDLRGDEGARAVLDQVRAVVDRVDILVNNVGGSDTSKGSWLDTTLDEWSDAYDANTLAAVRLVRALVPAMKARGWGRVIQISSRNAISPYANMPAYGAAKAALNNMTLSLSKELAFTGVTANAVMPGLIETDQVTQFLRGIAAREGWGEDLARAREHLLANVARQTVRRLGRPEDVAAYVCYVASPLSDFMTGSVVRIDGGSTPTL
ncbi:SDR family NAD(P)-dependent oxidoreductase [Sandaracinus amylolyticus]|uniref:Dehydrogenase n=1 Tax=Sandaracinus amylolyticus TaxID=927083 RepID=A0A0F6SE40_9BACT|nr:SDR family NAD(P)-dependent oxidoreductase [Sandaracinus amylolyticus]AKF04529.1 Dehydrogenase [Sandaracinus amylolyticus]